MSRILPRNNASWDYSLWEMVREKEEIVDKEEAKYIANYDRGGSAVSDYWKRNGRNKSNYDETKVIDFIGLENRFDTWFEAVRLRGPEIIEEIEEILKEIPNSKQYFEGCSEDWLKINWGILGRVVGAAIINIGAREKWFKGKGTDAKQSLLFWIDLKKNSPPISAHNGIANDDWDDIVLQYIERGFDPSGELRRSISHRPTAPFWKRDINFNVRYFPNPIALLHLTRFQKEFESTIDKDHVDELQNIHGTITMNLLRKALVYLRRGDYAEFAIRMHGLCAIHCMQDFTLQQKIGLHLVTNLGLRKELRGVYMLNVPDLAYEINTGFTFGKVLQILHRSKIIRWITVDKIQVDDAIKELKAKS